MSGDDSTARWSAKGPMTAGLTSLMILGVLEPYQLSSLDPGGLVAAHLFAQASRLAFGS